MLWVAPRQLTVNEWTATLRGEARRTRHSLLQASKLQQERSLGELSLAIDEAR